MWSNSHYFRTYLLSWVGKHHHFTPLPSLFHCLYFASPFTAQVCQSLVKCTTTNSVQDRKTHWLSGHNKSRHLETSISASTHLTSLSLVFLIHIMLFHICTALAKYFLPRFNFLSLFGCEDAHQKKEPKLCLHFYFFKISIQPFLGMGMNPAACQCCTSKPHTGVW